MAKSETSGTLSLPTSTEKVSRLDFDEFKLLINHSLVWKAAQRIQLRKYRQLKRHRAHCSKFTWKHRFPLPQPNQTDWAMVNRSVIYHAYHLLCAINRRKQSPHQLLLHRPFPILISICWIKLYRQLMDNIKIVVVVDLLRINAIHRHHQWEIHMNKWHHHHITIAIIVDHLQITEDPHHLLMTNDIVMRGHSHATTTDPMIDTTIDHMIVHMAEGDNMEIEIDHIDEMLRHRDIREDHDHHHEMIPIADQTTRIVIKDIIDVRLISVNAFPVSFFNKHSYAHKPTHQTQIKKRWENDMQFDSYPYYLFILYKTNFSFKRKNNLWKKARKNFITGATATAFNTKQKKRFHTLLLHIYIHYILVFTIRKLNNKNHV